MVNIWLMMVVPPLCYKSVYYPHELVRYITYKPNREMGPIYVHQLCDSELGHHLVGTLKIACITGC